MKAEIIENDINNNYNIKVRLIAESAAEGIELGVLSCVMKRHKIFRMLDSDAGALEVIARKEREHDYVNPT